MEAFTHIENKIINLGETHVYINSYNDDYDNIISINYYDDRESPEIVFGMETIVRYIPFQVRVRDTSFEDGYERIEAIRNLFSVYKYEAITITAKSDIMMLGNDEKNRSLLTINFRMKLIEGNTVTEETEETE
jgi:hypothetical protein